MQRMVSRGKVSPGRISYALTAAALLAGTSFATAAHAQNATDPGWYVSGKLGAGFPDDYRAAPRNNTPAPGAPGVGNGSIVFEDAGFTGLLAGGYAFGNGLRTELEGGYRYADVDRFVGLPGTGHARIASVMANAYYDFAIPNWPVTPYVGAGLGIADFELRARAPSVTGPYTGGSNTSMAFNAMAGVSYTLPSMPQLSFSAEYRYFQTPTFGFFRNPPAGSASGESYHSNEALLGITYKFSAPAAPPPAPAPTPVSAPAIQPAQNPTSYLVFFDFDKSNLTPQAQQIVASAAQNAKSGGVPRIQVTGHTDLSGSDQYNLALSKRRADAVAAELGRDGIPATGIDVLYRGKREPLVPTADGVREPQNRRAEIVFE